MFSREDFMEFDVVRSHVAEVIIGRFQSAPGDGFESDDGKPVRLIGFQEDPELTDYEILELAFMHYERLMEELQR